MRTACFVTTQIVNTGRMSSSTTRDTLLTPVRSKYSQNQHQSPTRWGPVPNLLGAPPTCWGPKPPKCVPNEFRVLEADLTDIPQRFEVPVPNSPQRSPTRWGRLWGPPIRWGDTGWAASHHVWPAGSFLLEQKAVWGQTKYNSAVCRLI